MTSLPQALFASLLLHRRQDVRRGTLFAPIGETDDLRAARERARKRS